VVELKYLSKIHIDNDKDYVPMRNRHLFIGGPLHGQFLSQEEFFSRKKNEEGYYYRFNASTGYGKLRAVWVYKEFIQDAFDKV
jgi:hypothetical protein